MKKNSTTEMELPKEIQATLTDNRPNIRVLMVEDDSDYRTFVRRLLIQKGQPEFNFTGVGSLSQCQRHLSQEMADVILLDLTLPDSTGVSTITKVSELCAGAPIIVLTGRDDVSFGLASVGLGAQDYLVKHRISNDGLIRCIRYAIERKKFEESKIRLAAIRDFISTLAHDLQVPLVGSNNVIDALLEGSFGQLSAEQTKVIEALKSGNNKQLHVVYKLLELYKYEIDSPNLIFESLDISKLIMSRIDAVSKTTQVTIEASLPETPQFVLGDRQAISRLIDHLIENAIRFGDNKKAVSVKVEANHEKLCLHIHNFGPPIPEEARAGMFERFWLGVPGKSYVAHTGIGLYLCHRIASLHRGRLACESSEVEGTTMSVRLPVHNEIARCSIYRPDHSPST